MPEALCPKCSVWTDCPCIPYGLPGAMLGVVDVSLGWVTEVVSWVVFSPSVVLTSKLFAGLICETSN